MLAGVEHRRRADDLQRCVRDPAAIEQHRRVEVVRMGVGHQHSAHPREAATGPDSLPQRLRPAVQQEHVVHEGAALAADLPRATGHRAGRAFAERVGPAVGRSGAEHGDLHGRHDRPLRPRRRNRSACAPWTRDRPPRHRKRTAREPHHPRPGHRRRRSPAQARTDRAPRPRARTTCASTSGSAGICHSDIHQRASEWGEIPFPMSRVTRSRASSPRSAPRSRVQDRRPRRRRLHGRLLPRVRELRRARSSTAPGQHADLQRHDYDGTSPRRLLRPVVVDRGLRAAHPRRLELDAAAPLLCAGITTYSPLRHWGAGPGKRWGSSAWAAWVTWRSSSPRRWAPRSRCSPTLRKKEDGLRLGADAYHATSDARRSTSSPVAST